ncbi:MAG: aminotransferase class V-fold PLP-dependent enzyme [Dehalococcoidia bacterium]|nr:aminotransferase class V-fold PLP-dependent enzyme [Dehalococcoidia bacterium]
MGEKRAYFDHAATTPLDLRVLEAMMPYLAGAGWGNPSSIYAEGREAAKGLDLARRRVAELLNCRPAEVIFTAGGSESDNLAIRGAAHGNRRRGDHIVTTAIEHHAVLHAVERLEQEGFRATYLPVDGEGFVDPGSLERSLTGDTTLVSVMYVNNEVGTIQPIAETAALVKQRARRIVFHTDAVQAADYLDLDVERLGVDMLSIAAHKLYGPKGVGALYVRQRTPLQAQLLGGSQERSRRAGTENVAGAVGLATALELAVRERVTRAAHVRELRDFLLGAIPADLARRLPSNLSLCFEGVEGEPILVNLDLAGMSASSGSACTTGSLEPSHVLTAMGIDEDTARGSLRLALGKDNTMEDCQRLVAALPEIVERVRRLQPSYRLAAERSAASSAGR